MPNRSLTNTLLITLGLEPSNKNLSNLKKDVRNISGSKIGQKLYKYHKYNLTRVELMESLDLASYTPLINNNYDKNKRDAMIELALYRLEYKILRIGRIYNRDKLNISYDTAKIIMNRKNKLIDIIRILYENMFRDDNNKLLYSIGKSLVYKMKHDLCVTTVTYNICQKWLRLDVTIATVIMADSFNRKGYYNNNKLEKRINTRICSDKILTKKLHHYLTDSDIIFI